MIDRFLSNKKIKLSKYKIRRADKGTFLGKILLNPVTRDVFKVAKTQKKPFVCRRLNPGFPTAESSWSVTLIG